MTGSVARGLAAGAAGTTVRNAVTFLDVLWRGRAPGRTPERVVDALGRRFGADVPGRGAVREHRLGALGALGGVGTGLGVGVVASAARAAGVRFSGPVGAVVAGAAAMAAADVPATALGISDPRTRSAADWVSDAVPHLAYGATVHAVLSAVPTSRDRERRTPASVALVFRAGALGVATGSRSSLGIAGPSLTTPPPTGRSRGRRALTRLGALAAVAGELVADKQPGTPPRTSAAGLSPRVLDAAIGSARLAGREGANGAAPVVAGALGALAGAFGGRAWRRWASRQVPDWQAALAEDVVALTLAVVACRPGRAPRPRPRLRVVPS